MSVLPNPFGKMNFIESKDYCSYHKDNETSPPNPIVIGTFPGDIKKEEQKIKNSCRNIFSSRPKI